MFVRNDGKNFKFCGAKCHKHFKRRHTPRKSRWTKAARAFRGKEMLNEGLLKEFEKRRNVPTRYNRDVYMQTIQAMKRINEIKVARAERFHERRMRVQHKKYAPMADKLAKKHDLLLNGPNVPAHKDLSKQVTKRRNQIEHKANFQRGLLRKKMVAAQVTQPTIVRIKSMMKR